MIGGFNRKWGLPLPQALAFSPSSVLHLRLSALISAKRLRKLEDEVLGERRIDSFGAGWQREFSLRRWLRHCAVPPSKADRIKRGEL